MSAEQDRLVRQQISSLLYSGDLVNAEAMCREHLKKRTRDHEAMAMLAHVNFTIGQLQEAERVLSRAISLDAKRADYQALMAEILTNSGRHREALGRYDRALKIHGRFEGAIAGKAETYLRMGKPDKALKFLDGVDTPVDDTPLLAIVKARTLIRLEQFESARSIAERHLPGEDLNQEHRRSLRFAAALATERTGDLEQATTYYQEANSLSQGSWDIEMARSQREATEEVFRNESFPELPRSDCLDESPIFIVGMLRSGSTLTEQIIDAHPEASGLGEIDTLPMLTSALQEILSTALPYPACLQETNEASLTSAAEVYLSDIRSRAPKARRRIDKQLGNFSLLGLIALLFPKARIIHCRRHPMDIGLSCWTQKFAPGTNAWANTQHGIAGFHQEYEAWMDLWRRVLPIPVLEVRYEDLVRDLDGQSRRIIDFCGLDWDDRCLRFWETGRTVLTLSSDQVRQPLYERSIGRHAPWGASLAPLRDEMGDAIGRYESGA